MIIVNYILGTTTMGTRMMGWMDVLWYQYTFSIFEVAVRHT